MKPTLFHHKKIALFLICFCLFLTEAKAGEKASLNLAQFYADPITKGLRKTFDNYHKQYRQNPSFYHVGIENMRPYFYLFAEKFIVMDIQETGFGGSFVTIMISPKKRFLWQLWISQIDTEEYNIREIKEIATNKEDAQQLTSLISEKLMKYWL